MDQQKPHNHQGDSQHLRRKVAEQGPDEEQRKGRLVLELLALPLTGGMIGRNG